MSRHPDRRQVAKTIIIGGVVTTVLLPAKWTKPVVETIIVPAHAQASPLRTTTSTTSTTSTTTSTTTPAAPPTAEAD